MLPNYQELMLPLLQLLADEREHFSSDLIEKLSLRFQLTTQEKKDRFSSGSFVFDSRVSWAKTYLKKAALIESTKRGTAKITALGKVTLAKNLQKIDNAYLMQFPDFVAFKNNLTTQQTTGNDATAITAQTPEEIFEQTYVEVWQSLASDLLDKVLEQDAKFFEKLVIELLVKMGYGGSVQEAGKALGKRGDEGIDGMIKEDKLGLDTIYIQAKRWQKGNTVGRPEIQKFVGALAGQGAKKGIFITTANFTKEALEYTPKNETKIVLVDGVYLSNLMLEYNLGCTTKKVYEIKEIDTDYFQQE